MAVGSSWSFGQGTNNQHGISERNVVLKAEPCPDHEFSAARTSPKGEGMGSMEPQNRGVSGLLLRS